MKVYCNVGKYTNILNLKPFQAHTSTWIHPSDQNKGHFQGPRRFLCVWKCDLLLLCQQKGGLELNPSQQAAGQQLWLWFKGGSWSYVLDAEFLGFDWQVIRPWVRFSLVLWSAACSCSSCTS